MSSRRCALGGARSGLSSSASSSGRRPSALLLLVVLMLWLPPVWLWLWLLLVVLVLLVQPAVEGGLQVRWASRSRSWSRSYSVGTGVVEEGIADRVVTVLSGRLGFMVVKLW